MNRTELRVKSRLEQGIAIVLIPGLLLTSVPVAAAPVSQSTRKGQAAKPTQPAAAQPQALPDAPGLSRPAPDVKVNRRVPRVKAVPAYPELGANPTSEMLTRARIFSEPLLPVGGSPSADENRALGTAVLAFLRGGDLDATEPLEAFLVAHSDTPWNASLLMNLGLVYKRTHRSVRARNAFDASWKQARDLEDQNGRVIADGAAGELLQLGMTFGRDAELDALLTELQGRDVRGPAAEMVLRARHTLWGLRTRHHEAVPSGPAALAQLLRHSNKHGFEDPRLLGFHATPNGASLVEMRDLANELGLKFRMAYRNAGADLVVPAMMHLKGEHFSAVVEHTRGRTRLLDPILGGDIWLSAKALEEEASGYFLVPARDALPGGWREVSDEEGGDARGKCMFPLPEPSATRCDDPTTGGDGGCTGPGCSRGMATYTINSLLVSTRVTDTPVGYAPARGPAVHFTVTYNQREAYQPYTFSFSNLGPRWSHDFLSYVEDNPSNPDEIAYVFRAGGGREAYQGFSGNTYQPEKTNRAVLRRVSLDPVQYQRELSDGSKEIFAQQDGAMTSPRRVFLTQIVDSKGHAATLTYDNQLRLAGITDALGQVTILDYEHQDPYKITSVTDPFGRVARFDYDSSGYLARITDVIGLSSEFEYGASDFMRALTTPYGTTRFRSGYEVVAVNSDGHPTQARWWLEVTDPLGGVERVEYTDGDTVIPASDPPATVPSGFHGQNLGLNSRNTFYWDKRAMALGPGDYAKAHVTHWLWQGGRILAHPVVSTTKHSEKKALEARVWYGYLGETAPETQSAIDRPVRIARVLDDGASQIYRFEYSIKGRIIKAIDPVGREVRYTYGTGSTPDANQSTGAGVDLLKIERKRGAGYDLLQSATYNNRHQPIAIVDAAGETTTYEYDDRGRIRALITPARLGLQPGESVARILTIAERTTTADYYPDDATGSAGQLKSVTGPSTPLGAPRSTVSYDSYGRVRTVTDLEGYALTYNYDVFDRVVRTTYPDGTYEAAEYDKLDVARRRSRAGRWAHTFYDALRRPTATRDYLGRMSTQVEWISCGGGCGSDSRISKLVDFNGNVTTWQRDLQGRVTRQVRADGRDRLFVYESAAGRLKEVHDSMSPRQINSMTYNLDNTLKQSVVGGAVASAVTYVYDSAYNRPVSIVDEIGATIFEYYPSGVMGAGQVARIDGPLPGTTDQVEYGFNEIGLLTRRQVGGSSSDVTWRYDALGRASAESNALGSFTYSYVGGGDRVATVGYPNGQSTSFGYEDVLHEYQLRDIHNTGAGGGTLSRHLYSYDDMGELKTWSQQAGSDVNLYQLSHDPMGQLVSALRTQPLTPGGTSRAWGFDGNGNRVVDAVDTTVTSSSYNNVNQLVAQQGGGLRPFVGAVSEAASVTVGGVPAQVTGDNRFTAAVPLVPGMASVPITATDSSQNVSTSTYQVLVDGAARTFTYDANGNLVSDGARSYEWNARGRLAAIVDGAHRSEFLYDWTGRRVRIVEKEGQAVVEERRLVWCGFDVCEERDLAGFVVKRFFQHGVQENGVAFYYSKDHLGSIREIRSADGSIWGRFDYDPWGNRSKTGGSKESDFGFAGYMLHHRSKLHLAIHREYSSVLGRWLSEDPAGLAGGPNLYAYVLNTPTGAVDPTGLVQVSIPTVKYVPVPVSEMREVCHFNPDAVGCTSIEPRLDCECEETGKGCWKARLKLSSAFYYVYYSTNACPSGPEIARHENTHVVIHSESFSKIIENSEQVEKETFPSEGECDMACKKAQLFALRTFRSQQWKHRWHDWGDYIRWIGCSF
jgi:RHS repeat-associated protein